MHSYARVRGRGSQRRYPLLRYVLVIIRVNYLQLGFVVKEPAVEDIAESLEKGWKEESLSDDNFIMFCIVGKVEASSPSRNQEYYCIIIETRLINHFRTRAGTA